MYVIQTGTLHREMLEFFAEQEPDRSVGDHFVEQFEPWRNPTREMWSDDDVEMLVRNTRRRRHSADTTASHRQITATEQEGQSP